MNALPPTLQAGRLRGSRRATPAAGVLGMLIAVVALATAACDRAVSPTPPTSPAATSAGPTATPVPSPTLAPTATLAPPATPTPDLAGLVLASDGSPTLGVMTRAGSLTPLEPPSRRIAGVESAAHGLLAVLRDGTIAVGRVEGSATEWTVDRRFSGVAAAAVDPTGTMLAIEGRRQFDEGGTLLLRVAPLGAGTARTISVSRLRANGAPVWLSDGRVAVVANTTAGANVLAVVDATTGEATTLPLDAIDIAASGDGETVALVEAAGMRVGPVDALGKATFGQPVDVVPPDGAQLAEAALDATGERIAFVWEAEDQTPLAIEIATAGSGWRVAGRLDVPSGARVIHLAWLG